MSIVIKRSDFNVNNEVIVTGFKLYRSDVSRQDCVDKAVHLVEMDLATLEYHDTATVENKLYWYRVDAETEYGLIKGGVRCMQWSNTLGIATGHFMHGDYECGQMYIDSARAMEFREAMEFKIIAMMREAGIILNGTSSAVAPYMYAASVVDGSIMMVARGLMNATNGGAWTNSDEYIIRMLAADRTFVFDGVYYEIDVLRKQELAKIAESPSVPMKGTFVYPHITTGYPVLVENPAPTGLLDRYRSVTIGFDPASQRTRSALSANGYNSDFVARVVR